MQYSLSAPLSLEADIQLPASKSISNRALILHALSKGTTLPANLSDCDDTRVMIRALTHPTDTIDIGAAGTAMRFLTAYLSATPGSHLLTGTARMRQRPIRILADALKSLGASIDYADNEGFPPLRIVGRPLQSVPVTLAGNVSSQYISALLMIGPILPQGLRLQLTGDIISRPYINLTLQLMRDFGAQAAWTSEDSIAVQPGGYQDTPFVVESDWSAASYWYETLALFAFKGRDRNKERECDGSRPHVLLHGLFPRSSQGDCRGAELFRRLGVQTEYTTEGVLLTPHSISTNRLEENLVDIPDLAQTFAVTCCLLDIPFRFSGLQSLRIKETDRIEALTCELKKLGYVIHAIEDSVLYWDGERCAPCPQPAIDTYEDHRMAMAFAPAAILFPHLRINQPQVVTKSYPSYWKDLQKAGFGIAGKE